MNECCLPREINHVTAVLGTVIIFLAWSLRCYAPDDLSYIRP